jgi:hypothetical protein
MALFDDRRTTGIYDDPHLQALALEAVKSGRSISPFNFFGLPPMAPQQPAMPPALLQLIAQMARESVETEPSWKMIDGTNIPDMGVREDAPRRLGPKENYEVDLDIETKPDPELDRGMLLSRPMPLPLFLMRR